MDKKLNSKIITEISCHALRALYSVLDEEETPFSTCVSYMGKGVRTVTIYAHAEDIPHFRKVLKNVSYDKH